MLLAVTDAYHVQCFGTTVRFFLYVPQLYKDFFSLGIIFSALRRARRGGTLPSSPCPLCWIGLIQRRRPQFKCCKRLQIVSTYPVQRFAAAAAFLPSCPLCWFFDLRLIIVKRVANI